MINVVGDQVLLRSHVLCNRADQFPPKVEEEVVRLTDERFEDRG